MIVQVKTLKWENLRPFSDTGPYTVQYNKQLISNAGYAFGPVTRIYRPTGGMQYLCACKKMSNTNL